jgi:hypothetical protein
VYLEKFVRGWREKAEEREESERERESESESERESEMNSFIAEAYRKEIGGAGG